VAVAPDIVLVHDAPPVASETRTFPSPAPVGSLNQIKLPVPVTSSVYPGFVFPRPIRAPVS
jgi:hypothetical protein